MIVLQRVSKNLQERKPETKVSREISIKFMLNVCVCYQFTH